MPFGVWKKAIVSLAVAAALGGGVAFGNTLLQAQNDFAKLDYASAYKSAEFVLAKQPANVEARRIAAKSARELEKYSECLKLSQEVPFARMDFEDVGLVGECSVRSVYTGQAHSILQRQLKSALNRDIAAYWMGTQLFLKNEFRSAEKLFSVVQVLPDRLEKERQKMLERIRAVLVAAVATPAPKPVATPAPKPVATPAPKPVATPAPTVPPVSPVIAVTAASGSNGAPDSPEGKIGQYAFLQGAFHLHTEFSSMSNNVSLDAFTQTEFENGFSESSIKRVSESGFDAGGTISLRAGLGSRNRAGENSKWNALAAVEFDASMSNRSTWIYQPNSRLKYPLGSVGTVSRGVEIGLVPGLQIAFGDHFDVEVGARGKFNAPETNRNRFLLDFHSSAALKSGYARLETQYIYEQYFVEKNAVFSGHNALADFRFEKFGILSLGAPPGYSLVRFARYTALPSTQAVRFVVMEGDFWEINIAPRLRLTSDLEAVAWYHWVGGTRRQFWSAKDLKFYYGVSKLDNIAYDSALYQPTAVYNSVSREVVAGLQWNGPSHLFVFGGAGWRQTSASFQNFEPLDMAVRTAAGNAPERYEPLINSAGGTTLRVFVSLGLSL
jgi:hypothetical protein